MLYFTADLHFGHENIIRHCNRPFASAYEMDEVLIKNWNTTVNPQDEIYILGDFTMRTATEAHKYLSRLNGRKYFIRGNHDRFLKNYTPYESDFVWIKDYHRLVVDNRRLILFHFPILEWDQFHRNAIHLYGHIHNSPASTARIDGMGLSFNVGVDCNDFRPISIEEIFTAADAKKAQA